MGIRNLNRWQASAGHLSFSVLLGLLVLALFRFLWYPGALFGLAGAGKLMLLVVGVDVVLGPLLTLIVFHPMKKTLIWDLAAIVTVQLGALSYGVWVMAQSRPVFMVGAVDRFELVTANQIEAENLKKSRNHAWRTLSWTGPVLVGTKPPDDPDLRLDIALEAASGGADITHLPQYFVDLAQVMPTLSAHGKPLSKFRAITPEVASELERSLNAPAAELIFFPLKARAGTGSVVMHPDRPSALQFLEEDGYGGDG